MLRKLAGRGIVEHGCPRRVFPVPGGFTGRSPRGAAPPPLSPILRHLMRPTLAAASLTLALAALLSGPGAAQDNRLPDIGSSAATVISPSDQAEYGAMMLSQLRYYGYTLEEDR